MTSICIYGRPDDTPRHGNEVIADSTPAADYKWRPITGSDLVAAAAGQHLVVSDRVQFHLVACGPQGESGQLEPDGGQIADSGKVQR